MKDCHSLVHTRDLPLKCQETIFLPANLHLREAYQGLQAFRDHHIPFTDLATTLIDHLILLCDTAMSLYGLSISELSKRCLNKTWFTSRHHWRNSTHLAKMTAEKPSTSTPNGVVISEDVACISSDLQQSTLMEDCWQHGSPEQPARGFPRRPQLKL